MIKSGVVTANMSGILKGNCQKAANIRQEMLVDLLTPELGKKIQLDY